VAFGAGHDRVCALVDMDMAAVGAWADRQAASYSGHADLSSLDETYGLIGECIAKVNAELARDPVLAQSQIHRFVILPKALSAGDGALTHTGKLRRDVVAERYRPLVDAIYEGRTEARLDGGGGRDDAHAAPAVLKIRDAKVHAPPPARKAA
jgi:long-chain acyl-CoA synthetase